uniref:protein CEBPZOS-like n=1 Tax=Scatophagus argus TaxID=75038 RepID=UPI001ED7F6B0|nr:protein CEBPZOS-like [Scatophagus argus]
MPLKPPGRWAVRVMKRVVLVEVAGAYAAFCLFHMMDRSQDFRNTMKRRLPSVLEVYYRSYEWAGYTGIRERDHEAWAAKQN